MRWHVCTYCRPKGKWNLWVNYHGNPLCRCVYACILVHVHGCGVSIRAPLEDSSKSVITDRQMNSAFYFLRQMSGLTLMVHRGDGGMSGERRQSFGKLMITLWNDLYQQCLITWCLQQYPLSIVSNQVNEMFCIKHRRRGGHTFMPLSPLVPGAPTSPLKP